MEDLRVLFLGTDVTDLIVDVAVRYRGIVNASNKFHRCSRHLYIRDRLTEMNPYNLVIEIIDYALEVDQETYAHGVHRERKRTIDFASERKNYSSRKQRVSKESFNRRDIATFGELSLHVHQPETNFNP